MKELNTLQSELPRTKWYLLFVRKVDLRVFFFFFYRKMNRVMIIRKHLGSKEDSKEYF